ncbi:MAG TPA: hypothetical protein PLI42_00680 [Candidatus Pacearchaeota archaeon]|nr:hypothetical protein [Candidatus Pacearchaeota archaeon]HOS12498.1 hypothetical protein [Candidatus Pacearchaeota archaeon]
MDIAPIPNVKSQKNPLDTISKLLNDIDAYDIDAMFMDKDKKKGITRAYIEMCIEDMSLWTQNQTLFNKFLQTDTKLEKALREYQAEIKNLLSSIVNTQYVQSAPSVPQQVAPTPVINPQELQPVPAEVQPAKKVSYPTSIGIS